MLGDEVTVSAVIPTRGRPELVSRAASSALEQSLSPLEVIVVIDGNDPATEAALDAIDDARLIVVRHLHSAGAGAARNTGIRHARGSHVAFLDDDDRWLPDKLARQIEALHQLPDPAHAVIGTAARWETGETTHIWPTRAPRADERIGEYLFVRDHPGEGALATPTVLLATELARSTPMPTDLHTHEEWAWFLDLEQQGASFHVVLKPLVVVDARPRRSSVSTGSEWGTSMDWARQRAAQLGRRAYSGFVLTEVARSAVLGGAPLRAHLSILRSSLAGRPRLRDLARAIGRPIALRGRVKGLQ